MKKRTQLYVRDAKERKKKRTQLYANAKERKKKRAMCRGKIFVKTK